MADLTISRESYSANPYRNAAWIYRDAGWEAPIPVDFAFGGPVPKGFTGGKNAHAYPPSDTQIQLWCDTIGQLNMGLWLPRDVIGIDVDAYGDRRGDETLNFLEHQVTHEPFPSTWTSTARGLGQPSRIHFFKIDDAHEQWISRKSGIDIVRFGHRFARVWPSVKQDKERSIWGARYRWYDPAGHVVPEGYVPEVSELTSLSHAWVSAFRKRSRRRATRTSPVTSDHVDDAGTSYGYGDSLSAQEINEWVRRLHSDDSDESHMCGVITAMLVKYTNELHAPSGRHDAAKDGIWAILHEGVHGHVGTFAAVNELESVFMRVVTEDGSRADDLAESEWARMLIGAVERIAAAFPHPDTSERCSCNKYQQYLANLGFGVGVSS